jgi:hypothetical protein
MFKLTHTNKNGTFKIILNRDVSNSEMNSLCQLAANLVPSEITPAVSEAEFFGPQQNPKDTINDLISHIQSQSGQVKLGETPVDHINLGTYKVPIDGVRIKMLSFMDTAKIPAVKAFREATGIGAVGCKEIICGNYPCPILTLETATKILEKFKELSVFAKIVPAVAEAA